jgi:hypothetical protein
MRFIFFLIIHLIVIMSPHKGCKIMLLNFTITYPCSSFSETNHSSPLYFYHRRVRSSRYNYQVSVIFNYRFFRRCYSYIMYCYTTVRSCLTSKRAYKRRLDLVSKLYAQKSPPPPRIVSEQSAVVKLHCL